MNTIIERQSQIRKVTWAGATQSGQVDIEGGSVFSIYLPSAFTGTALNVESLEDDGTWAPYFIDVTGTSTLLSIPVTAAKRNQLPDSLFAGFKVVRFVSTASETVVGTLNMSG